MRRAKCKGEADSAAHSLGCVFYLNKVLLFVLLLFFFFFFFYLTINCKLQKVTPYFR